MTFGPEDVTRKPGEKWSAYQSRMLDLLGPEEKRAAIRRRGEWQDRYALWLSRMRETHPAGWNPPAHSDTWRKWRRKTTPKTPEGVAICREWAEAHSLELAKRRKLELAKRREIAKLELAKRRKVAAKRKPKLEPAVKPRKRVKPVVRRKVAKRKITAKLEPANQREIDKVLYSRWLHRMLDKHGEDWTPAPCVSTWRKWRNRRREMI